MYFFKIDFEVKWATLEFLFLFFGQKDWYNGLNNLGLSMPVEVGYQIAILLVTLIK